MLWLFISALLIILDQITKYYINSNVDIGVMHPVINSFFYITHYENTGIAWSLLNNKTYIFVPITIILTIAVGYYLRKTSEVFLKLCLSLVLGGAVGNLIDRIYKGSVTDFLEFHFGSYIFPIFNVADICVVIGVFLLAYYILFLYKEDEKI
jgi:signal peptidase II